MTELHGAESSGKTTICLQGVANAQRQGLAGYIDLENALDVGYSKALGVDFSKLAMAQPTHGEEAFEIADALMRGGAIMVVIDSIPALTPKAQLEGEYEDKNYGAIAHLLSRSLQKLKAVAAENNCALVFTNQLRIDQRGYSAPGMPLPTKTYGGEAPKYYADLRIKLRRNFDKDKKLEEQNVIATVVKNKLFPPFKEAVFQIVYGQGVNRVAELVDIAVEREIVKKSGGWYTFGEVKTQGLDALVEHVRSNPDMVKELEKGIRG
jgi:recombination protein RecA